MRYQAALHPDLNGLEKSVEKGVFLHLGVYLSGTHPMQVRYQAALHPDVLGIIANRYLAYNGTTHLTTPHPSAS